MVTVSEYGDVVAVNGLDCVTIPTEFVPTKNSTGPVSPSGLAKSSAVKTNVLQAAKKVPFGGELIAKTGAVGKPPVIIIWTDADTVVAPRLSIATALRFGVEPEGTAVQITQKGALVATPIRVVSAKNCT